MGVAFELTDPGFLADPFPTYAALRAEGPVWLHPEEHWFVSRYTEVARVLKSHEEFSSRAMMLPGVGDTADGSLIGQDPPVHTRQRNIVNRGFTPRRIEALGARIAARVDALFGEFQSRGEVELMRELAAPLPVMVIAELLGLEPARHADFKRWSDDMIVGPTGDGDAEERVARSVQEMLEHLSEVIEIRRSEPAEDQNSAQVGAHEKDGVLEAAQVLHFAQLLLAAGSETTTNLIGNAVLALLSHPEQHERVRSDRSLVPAWIEETLRFDSPVQLLMRRTNGEVLLGDVTLPDDSLVMVLLGSANRDEREFPDPDAFDVRRNAQGHLAFGLGNHFCLGSALARLQARIALEAVLERLPNLELATDHVERHGSFLVRGPHALPLRFSR
jgi:cytochrome P450